MDARRQKRLGPAPIASFEKSFEDNTTMAATAAAATTTNAAQQQHQQHQQQQQQHQQRVTMMEQTLRKQTTTTTTTRATTATRTTTEAATSSGTAPGGSSNSTSSSSSTSTVSSATCSANATTIVAKQRPPPLKTATTTVTTTLVSSNEGGQPLPASAAAATAASTATGAAMHATYRGSTTLTTPSTPRIELSRASSSSHHEEDSRESSPENVFDQETIGLGFREEGALELRSSTEELYFMDPEQKKEEQERLQQQQQQQQQQTKRSSPHIFKFDDHQSYLQQHQRKDSASSEVAALLCISGRTSRISSVGSQGSAVSRLSAVSCVSRSPSPHRMLLETSFCGPKPMEPGTDGVISGAASNASTAPSSAQSLGEATLAVEQLLLARTKHDPTQVVLAEGIQMQPQATATATAGRKIKPTTLANGDSKPSSSGNQTKASGSASNVMGAQRRSTKSPGQMVIGKTPSGTEYIRINLRPDHMYSDKGIAANERVVEAPNQLTPVYSKSSQPQSKPPPASLSLQGGGLDEHRLTPTASPKPSRHALRLTSRSPSPAAAALASGGGTVSRKSSFSSLFRLGKDSPDSPRETSRSRSKSKERPSTAMAMTTTTATTAAGSQNVTPSKQKSVLAIFKPGKRGSSAGTDGTKSSKSSSPIDCVEPPPPPPPAPGSGRSRTPAGSRPNSRLRYYDEPVEGYIHIPLHTPPEEREARTLLQGIQQLAAPSPPPMHHTAKVVAAAHAQAHAHGLVATGTAVPAPAGAGAPITASQLAAAAAALRPVGQRKAPTAQAPPPRTGSDLDAIQTLPAQEELEKQPRNWSLDVQRHSSSQESQETLQSISSVVSARAANLAQVAEQVELVRENGLAEMQRLPSVDSTQSACEPRLVQTVATVNAPIEDPVAKERRRLLFATRLGSGSQEQIFSTQFSISKTESQSSQLSEQVQLPDSGSTASDCTVEGLQRQGTVIRRTDLPEKTTAPSSSEEEQAPAAVIVSTAVVMRSKHKSCSNSEEETTTAPPAPPPAADVRHSRYLENFDVRKKYHENVPTREANATPQMSGHASVPRKPKRQTVPETKPPSSYTPTSGGITPTTPTVSTFTELSEAKPEGKELTEEQLELEALSPTPNADRSERQSTDEHEPIESSESERDSDMAGSSSMATAVPMGAEAKRHHFPRNVCLIEEHESTGLVSQESFDDELPYIPTTLPEERAQGIPLIPMKERANMELKTCPVDRPRSTTPLNPSHLEEYCTGIMTPQESPHAGHELDVSVAGGPVRGEKLRISLPRKDSTIKDKGQSTKSPRRISNASGKSWFEFAEEGLRANNLERKDSNKQLLPAAATAAAIPVAPAAPAAPAASAAQTPSSLEEPKPKASTQRKLSGHWIDFENIPEKRKPAKRITTLPKETITTTTTAITSASSACASTHRTTGHPHAHHSHAHAHGHHHHHQQSSRQDASGDKLHYNYVKPEDCQCECHEAERGESSVATAHTGDRDKDTSTGTGTGTGSDSLASVELLQQGEDMLPLLEPETQPETRVYTDEPLPPPARHVNKNQGSRLDEFPRRETAQSSRNRKFPDRK